MSGFSEFMAFAVTARHASFAGAGRELGVTASTIAKRILRLEERLGTKLFHRTTRQVTLTVEGEALFARCEKVLADIDEIESLASGTNGEPRGQLRISMPITYGKHVIMPRLARLLPQYPGLQLDVRLTDSFCDLIKDGMDAAIRVGPLEDWCSARAPPTCGSTANQTAPASWSGIASSFSATRRPAASGPCACSSTEK
jgi:DNA-binding transcriptional LysR family regulator